MRPRPASCADPGPSLASAPACRWNSPRPSEPRSCRSVWKTVEGEDHRASFPGLTGLCVPGARGRLRGRPAAGSSAGAGSSARRRLLGGRQLLALVALPSSAFIFASSSSTWPLCWICESCRSMSSPCAVKSSSVPEAVSSSTASARACICVVLSFARSIASPTSAMCSPIPVAASPIRTCASAAEYCALITSFWVRKDSILA